MFVFLDDLFLWDMLLLDDDDEPWELSTNKLGDCTWYLHVLLSITLSPTWTDVVLQSKNFADRND